MLIFVRLGVFLNAYLPMAAMFLLITTQLRFSQFLNAPIETFTTLYIYPFFLIWFGTTALVHLVSDGLL